MSDREPRSAKPATSGQQDGSEAPTVLAQSFSLLEYLSAVAREIGPQPVRDVRKHAFTLWPGEVPDLRGTITLGPAGERTSWLEARRTPAPEPAPLDEEFEQLLEDMTCLSDPDVEPSLSSEALARYAEQAAAAELEASALGSHDDRDGDRARIEAQVTRDVEAHFEAWTLDVWAPWARAARPILAARSLYSRLYELHLSADADAATHEVVWGYLVLSYAGGGTPVTAPLLTASMAIEVDSEDATIRVVPEQPVQLELSAVEGVNLPGVDGLSNLHSTMRAAPPDPWSPEERQAVRRQLVAPLGLDATLVDTAEVLPAGANVRLNDGWVLVKRPRSLRQERFYDELAHKIRDEEFLPGALASVIADKDRVDSALRMLGQDTKPDDGTADRLMMPLPTNAEQERIARQLAQSRGVTVQGPPGTGKSHTIINLVSHLVAQGKRVLVTAEKEQALSVLRDKIPPELRDLSIAVLGSTPSAMEDLRSSAQSMQDSLSALDVTSEVRRIDELGATIDRLRESLARTDHALVEALRSESQEYALPDGPSKAPQVAVWLASDRHLDVIVDRVPHGNDAPVTVDEMAELASTLQEVSADDHRHALLDLPAEGDLPASSELGAMLRKVEELRAAVTALEDGGLRLEALDVFTLEALRDEASALRAAAAARRELTGVWEERIGAAIRSGDTAWVWVSGQNAAIQAKLSAARELASLEVGHVYSVPEGDAGIHLEFLREWRSRIALGKRLSVFAAKPLREFASQITVDAFPATTLGHLDLVEAHVRLRVLLREIHTLMTQSYAPLAIPVPPLDSSFRFAADHLAQRLRHLDEWWRKDYPGLTAHLHPLTTIADPAANADSLSSIASLFDGAVSRLEERELTSTLARLRAMIDERRSKAASSPLWGDLLAALDMARPLDWDVALTESSRLLRLRPGILRGERLLERISERGAPRWARSIAEVRGEPSVVGSPDDVIAAWDRARARTWLASLHSESDVGELMDSSHAESQQLRRAIVDMASRSARVELKRNQRDSQRRALESWLTAVKRVGRGTGKNAPRFQAAARDSLPAAMGAVPIWIMPIYRVMENFDPRLSELFDVVVVDESSQCDLLSLGVLALAKKSVVVGDDKQTTPERVGVQTDRVAALQDQYLHGGPEARLLTVDESLYSISARAFPSTIALREHFRCVPEIIGFSNRYYNGTIQPLREVGVPGIGDPVRAVRVPGAISTDHKSGRVNRDEARAIADQVAACIADPAYDGLTFGVVTMMSGSHTQILQDMIRDRIGDEVFEQRRLRVGNPPAFQGDERNVVFVSMVAHDSSFAATAPRYAQWANVAASRAQDQLWVFHSMDPTTLNHADERRGLIEYAQSHGRRTQGADLFSRTESKFESDVLRQILDRGFDVEPQYRVGSYRIDFVVRVAAGERIAVECDGDSFHGPDKWDDDVRRQRVLERLGWTFWRIRASKYYLEPDEAMRPLWDRLEAMRSRAAEVEASTASQLAREEARLLAAANERDERSQARSVDGVDEPDVLADTVADPVVETEGIDDVAPAVRPLAGGSQRDASDVEDGGNESLGTLNEPFRVRVRTPVSDSPEPEAHPAQARPSDVRQWARDNGFDVGVRGRLHSEVLDAYARAHSRTADRDRATSDYSDAASDRAALLKVWAAGRAYQLDSMGDVIPRGEIRTLEDTVGARRAASVRDRLRSSRPGGGRFKADESGIVVTMVDGEVRYVTRVSREEWFPDHLLGP